jgi:hypothetical protein
MRAFKTVFIVGAGASHEVGVPFGREFLETIATKLDFKIVRGSLVPNSGDADILDAVQQYARDRQSVNGYLSAARRIRDGVPFASSIDTFIDAHRDDEKIRLLAKLAIAKTILEYEQKSCLHISAGRLEFRDVGTLNKAWLIGLARGLNDGVRRSEVKRVFERVSLIVFNYDRCIEHFLHASLCKHYGIDDGEARSVMETLTILHPYGTIAKLPWQDNNGLPFGFPTNRPDLLMMSNQIKTFTEQVEDSTTLEAIKRELASAETIVFLGFSYHELNMQILKPRTPCVVKNIFGTAFGVSGHDIEHIKEEIRSLVGCNLVENRVRGGTEMITERLHVRHDLKCADLLQEYSRTLFVVGRGARSDDHPI